MLIVYKSDYDDLDRWIPFDRYPRQFVRNILGSKVQLTGQNKALKNTCLGLSKMGVDYLLNPPKSIIDSSEKPVMLFGQSNVIEFVENNPQTKFIVGPALYSHPIEMPRLAEYENVHSILVPGPWMKNMCQAYWGDKVVAWPVGIDTDEWSPANSIDASVDFLLYDKIMWDKNGHMLSQIIETLEQQSLSYEIIKYGHYEEEAYKALLAKSRSMIYLCEHESQGIAYQQALSAGITLLVWDRNDYWLDPRFYPERVKYKPVSSVPYWDERCGAKFDNIDEFSHKLSEFLIGLESNQFDPRSYVLENLTLDHSTQSLLDIYNQASIF